MTEKISQHDWLYWFKRLNTDDAIRLATYTPVIPIIGLQSLGVEEACRKLNRSWEEIFFPGTQHIQILRKFLDQAIYFSSSVYPTIKDYIRLRNQYSQPQLNTPHIQCLTGLAGVSKSSLMKAFVRMCQLDNHGSFIAEGHKLTLQPVRRISIDAHASAQAVLTQLSNPMAVSSRGRLNLTDSMAHVSDWLSATATSTLVVDEMQFFTQSSTASTKTSQLLMTTGNLGPSLIFVANYSLVNKLMKRPQEEKDRLLASPIVLYPPQEEDVWWVAVIEEYLAVSPESFRLDALSHAQELHRLTAGLFRALRNLLVQAYREASLLGKSYVTIDEVRLAYRSTAYSIQRKDIEDLVSLSISNLMEKTRPDLTCPFSELIKLPASKVGTKIVSNGIQPQSYPSSFSPACALVESTLSKGAKATLQTLREASQLPKEERINAKVSRLPKRSPPSAQSLLEGAQLLRKVESKPKSSSKISEKSLEKVRVK